MKSEDRDDYRSKNNSVEKTEQRLEVMHSAKFQYQQQ